MLLEMLGLPTNVHEYRRGYHPPVAAAPSGGSEELRNLTALGYLGATESRTAPAGATTRTAGSFNNEGLILRDQHRDDEAAAAFENALRIDARNPSALWNLSELLHFLQRDPARAAALLDAAIEADPHQLRWLFTRGRYALERHDCEAALRDFQRAAQIAPNNAIAYASVGTAQACLGHDAAAIAAFQQSLYLDPNQPQLARLLAGQR
jgi:tetratricopeptide (TPR) repeat protein